MSSHTAGPWSTDADHPSTWHPKIYAETDRFIGPLCEMYSNLSLPGTDPRLREEMGANARLIAAAPDLLSLLKEARSTLEMWKDVAPAVSLCADIDKAIAKATGGQL